MRRESLLSVLVGALAAAASAGGLFIDGLYKRDTVWASSQLRGNDLVTLVVAVPLLAVALVLAERGSLRARLVRLGALAYMAYNYAFYLFGAAFNELFLIYVAAFSLSLGALILGLAAVDAAAVARLFRERTPVRGIAAYMFFIAVFLGFNWMSRALGFLTSGRIPQDILNSGLPTAIVYAIDLSLLVPALGWVGALLWKRRPWGYVLGTVLMVKCATYPLALIGMGIFAARAGVPGARAMMPFWIGFAAVSLVALGLLLGNMKSADRPAE